MLRPGSEVIKKLVSCVTMRFLPFENYVLYTSMPPEKAKKRLCDNIEMGAGRPFSQQQTTKLYQGALMGDGFRISRVSKNRNAFLPVVTGRWARINGQTAVRVSMQSNVLVFIFLFLWIGLLGMTCLCIILMGPPKDIRHPHQGWLPSDIIPFGLLLMGYILPMVSFSTESFKARQFLTTLFTNDPLP